MSVGPIVASRTIEVGIFYETGTGNTFIQEPLLDQTISSAIPTTTIIGFLVAPPACCEARLNQSGCQTQPVCLCVEIFFRPTPIAKLV